MRLGGQIREVNVQNKDDEVKVIDVSDPLFKTLAELPQEKMLALIKIGIEKHKAKQQAAQQHTESGDTTPKDTE